MVNRLYILEQNLLAAAVIKLRGPAVGVAGNALSGFKETGKNRGLRCLSHRMSPALLDTNATASSATPHSKRGFALAVKDGCRSRSTASAVS